MDEQDAYALESLNHGNHGRHGKRTAKNRSFIVCVFDVII